MSVIQSLIDGGTDIEVTLNAPVENVDIHVNFYTDLLDGKPVVKDTCLVRPINTLMNFVVKNPNRANYVGLNCYVEVKVNVIGFPDNIILDETSVPIAIN